MAYDVYLDKVLLPVAPSKLQIKIKNQNKTITLINEGEINLLKTPGLTEISFTVLIPHVKYPFATYKNDFQDATFFLSSFDRLKKLKQTFQFIVYRSTPDGNRFFNTGVEENLKVTLEDYTITEEAENGFDLNIDINLKQWRDYRTKTVQINIPEPVTKSAQKEAAALYAQQHIPELVILETRPAESAPKAKTHKVVKGDTLWGIAKKYLGNGSRYPEIYSLNQEIIDKRNKGTGNSKYTIYPEQIFAIPT